MSESKSRASEAESIEQFLGRASVAGFRELWVSIGMDERSGLTILHLSPRAETPERADIAWESGISTRSYYVDGDNVHPADQTMTFSEAIMRSSMSPEKKLHWLYETCRDWERQAMGLES